MHSCSDKGEGGGGQGGQGGGRLSRRITWSDSSLSQRRQRHAAVWPQETGGGGGGSLILIPGYCGTCGERSLGDRGGGGRVGGGASSSAGRKEEFPPASDCLTCKKVPFVATTSLLVFSPSSWQSVGDQLSPFPPVFFSPPSPSPPPTLSVLSACSVASGLPDPVRLDSWRPQPLIGRRPRGSALATFFPAEVLSVRCSTV